MKGTTPAGCKRCSREIVSRQHGGGCPKIFCSRFCRRRNAEEAYRDRNPERYRMKHQEASRRNYLKHPEKAAANNRRQEEKRRALIRAGKHLLKLTGETL